MDALLLLIGVGTAGALGFGFYGAYQVAFGERVAAVRRMGGMAGMQSGLAPAGRLLRSQSRFPLVDRLPLSPASREQWRVELDRAGQPLKVSEYLALRLACALGLALVTALVLPGVVSLPGLALAGGVLGMALFGWLLPRSYVSRRRRRRLARIEHQLPDALTAIAKSLRAGSGLVQAYAYAADTTDAPLGFELRATLRDLQLGADPAEALAALSARVGSGDLDIAVTAMIIQRQAGGNLAEILESVTRTVRERVKIHREIETLTARQKLTGNMVAAVPVLVAAAFWLLNRDIGNLVFTTATGRIALAVGIGFEIIGIVLIRKLAVVEV